MYINNTLVGGTTINNPNFKSTRNSANLYIGNKGGNSNFFSGSISQLKICNKDLPSNIVNNHYKSSNGSPYIGNIFYPNGLVTITHPDYNNILSTNVISIGEGIINPNDGPTFNNRFIVGGNESYSDFFSLNQLKFQGSHLIYEYEYQCTLDEYEFNSTQNPTIRKTSGELENFATSSTFNPYITTIGLYNDNYELLAIGKLGQPIRSSNKTDTTFIIRWDT